MAEARNDTLTETVVYRGDTCSFTMTHSGIQLTPNRGHETRLRCCGASGRHRDVSLRVRDLIGAEVVSHSKFRIHYQATAGSGAPQRRVVLRHTENIDTQVGDRAPRLVRGIRQLARNEVQRSQNERPKILVMINPKAGRGKAQKIFDEKVFPFVRHVLGWRCDSESTTERGHGKEIIATRVNLGEYLMIALMGGDGTIHEALEGLLRRDDWRDCIHIPFIPFPIGSGNALATSLEITDIDSALIAMTKHNVKRMDVLSVDQDGNKCYSFLGIMYGALSAIDIESENLRWMGDCRFTIGAIRELYRMQRYRVKLAYLPEDEGSSLTHPEGHDASGAGGPSIVPPPPPPPPSGSDNAQVPHKTDSCADRPLTLESKVIGPQVMKWFTEKSTESAHGHGNWILEPDCDIRLLAALNIPYISKTSCFMPHAGLNDGALHLMKVPTPKSNRRAMYRFLTKSQKGEHLSLPNVHVCKIRALLFEPIEGASWLTVDGEVIPSETVSVEVFPQLINVLSLPPDRRC